MNGDDALAGADRVILLSFAAWTNRFGSDPDIVGTFVLVDGQPHEIAGVLGEGFRSRPAREHSESRLVVPAVEASIRRKPDRT